MNARYTTLIALTLAASTVGCATASAPVAQAPALEQLASDEMSTTTSGGDMCTIVRRGAEGGVKDARIAEHWPTKNYGAAASSFAGNVSGGARQTLLGFDLPTIPAGAKITSAKIRLHKCVCGGNGVSAHQVTSAWSERDVTWNSFGGAYNEHAFAQLPVGSDNHTSLDITDLARSWADGSAENHGVLLTQQNANTAFSTSEAGDAAQRPTLEICWTNS